MPSTSHHRIPIWELGEDYSISDWKNYGEILPPEEFNEEYLLNLLCDPSLADAPGSLPWVPLHAWRALAQLRRVSAIEPTLRLADDDGYQQAYNDFEQLSAEIGEPAIGPLTAILADRARSEISRTLAVQGLGAIARSAAGTTRADVMETVKSQTRDLTDLPAVNSAAAEALLALHQL